ncbi:MAG: GTPase [Oscillospiraceae bacterium]
MAAGEPYPVSSVHGHGTGDLLDAYLKYFPPEKRRAKRTIIKVAVIGKPNVGKSSLVNRIIGEDRLIVATFPAPHATPSMPSLKAGRGDICLHRHAGIRRKSKVEGRARRYSVLRYARGRARGHVALVMIDATDGVTEQDTKIAGFAHE